MNDKRLLPLPVFRVNEMSEKNAIDLFLVKLEIIKDGLTFIPLSCKLKKAIQYLTFRSKLNNSLAYERFRR